MFVLNKLSESESMTADISKIYSYVASRKVIKKLFKLPYRTQNYLVCGIVEGITVKLGRGTAKFVHSMISSKHSTVRELIGHFLTTEYSVFLGNCTRYIMYNYDISVFTWFGIPL